MMMCRWDPGTLEPLAYTRARSSEFCYPTRLNYQNPPPPPHPRVSAFQKLPRSQKVQLKQNPEFANFIDQWSQFDSCFTNFEVILEYLESSIRLSSMWSWHVYTIVRDTLSSRGGRLTWKAQIHDGGHRVNFDRNLPSSCFVVQYNSLISMT